MSTALEDGGRSRSGDNAGIKEIMTENGRIMRAADPGESGPYRR